jgi:polyphosphate kinase
MPRNLFERCETIFPIRDAALRDRVRDEILAACLADTVKARLLRADGEYIRVADTPSARNAPRFSSQDCLIHVAEGKSSARDIPPAILYPIAEEQAPASPAAKPANGKAAKKTTRALRRKKPASAAGLRLAASEEDPIESALS